jgi:hypothetical protein
MFYILVLVALLVGVGLSLRFKVLILYPAIALITIGMWISNLGNGDSFGLTLLTNISLAGALQLGYLLGLIFQAGSDSPSRNPSKNIYFRSPAPVRSLIRH